LSQSAGGSETAKHKIVGEVRYLLAAPQIVSRYGTLIRGYCRNQSVMAQFSLWKLEDLILYR
jgi:hypothetical protein